MTPSMTTFNNMDSFRWKSSHLQAVENFQYLKQETEKYNGKSSGRVNLFLLRRLECLIDSMLRNTDFRIQLEMLGQIRKWYDSHCLKNLQEAKVAQETGWQQKQVSLSVKNEKIREKKKLDFEKNWVKRRKTSVKETILFETNKKIRVHKWSKEKTRRTEDSLYRYELARASSEGVFGKKKRNCERYLGKLKILHDKHKELINPLYFTFEQEEKTVESPKKYEIGETNNVKRRLAKRSIIVSMKILEPYMQFETEKSLPRGGDGLLRQKKFD